MSGQFPGRCAGRHWVVIETGANQAYVFASNKQAVNVGASELIWRVGNRWIDDALPQVLREGPEGRSVWPVVQASGKALLLVESPETGRAVIRAVTRRALDEAPGLEVWGIVDDAAIVDDADVGPALTRAHRLQAGWRSRRPSSQLRRPTLPFIRPCHYSGRPATAVGVEGKQWHPRAASVDRAWSMRDAGRDRMANGLGDRAVVRPDLLNDGVDHAGWIAVVHADGNGIGEIFRTLPDVYRGTEFLEQLRTFSKALEQVTIAALGHAVRARSAQKGWLLPLVVGGDDVTVVMDARAAFEVTTMFLREFAARSAANAVITEVVARVQEHLAGDGDATPAGRRPVGDRPVGLTACAGIAYVKPRYAFSAAYQLAEELCASAKRVKETDPQCGALDFHVLHDSVGRGLDRVRESLTSRTSSAAAVQPPATPRASPTGPAAAEDELRLWAGPVVVSGEGVALSDWADAHHERWLREAMTELGGTAEADEPPALSRSALHQLRQALLRGGPEIGRTVSQVVATAPCRDRATTFLNRHLVVPGPARPGEDAAHLSGTKNRFSRILSVVDLVDMLVGTDAGNNRETRTGDNRQTRRLPVRPQGLHGTREEALPR